MLAARERILADPLLAETARGDNHRQIWTLLGRVNPDRLRATARGHCRTTTCAAGWSWPRSTGSSPKPTRNGWPPWPTGAAAGSRHPAAIEPPAGIADTLRPLEAAQQQGHARVLLLLPLSGPLAAAGEVVRDGFHGLLLPAARCPAIPCRTGC